MKFAFALLAATGLTVEEHFPVSIRIDTAKPLGELKPNHVFFRAHSLVAIEWIRHLE